MDDDDAVRDMMTAPLERKRCGRQRRRDAQCSIWDHLTKNPCTDSGLSTCRGGRSGTVIIALAFFDCRFPARDRGTFYAHSE